MPNPPSKWFILIFAVYFFVGYDKIYAAVKCADLFAQSTPRFVLDNSWMPSAPKGSFRTPAMMNVHRLKPLPYVYLRDLELARNLRDVFVMAGVNSNRTIETMVSLTGVSLDILTRRALPNEDKYKGEWGRSDEDEFLFAGLGKASYRRSGVGQILRGQDMRQVLLHDNTTVLEQGLTHQVVASPLLSMIKFVTEEIAKPQSPHVKELGVNKLHVDYEFGGRKYSVSVKSMGRLFGVQRGGEIHSGWAQDDVDFQASIFNDMIYGDWHFTVTDVASGETLNGDALTANLIYRYGFYQSGPYRMDPRRIIDFFKLR